MKTASPKLFRLLKSLSGSERRYIKLQMNPTGKKNNKYIQLFDAIEQQEVFDDEQLKGIIYPNEQIESRKYSELKAYLYHEVLLSLQGYDEHSSIEYKLKGYLLNVRVLFKRSLFSECDEQVKKAKKLAKRYERFNELLEVLAWEKELLYAKTDIGGLDKSLESIQGEEQTALEQLYQISEYRDLFLKLLVELRKNVTRSKAQLERLAELSTHPLLQKDVNPTAHKAKVHRLRFESAYKYATSDLEAFYQSSKSLLILMESKPHFLKENVSEYISVINNHLVSCGNLMRFEEVEMYLEKLKKVKPITKDDELKIYRQYYLQKIKLCTVTGEFQKGLKLIQKHESVKHKYDSQFFEKGVFYFHYFNIHFGIGDYQKALYYLNEWLGMPKHVERQDLQALSRVLNLIVHYEMGNSVLLESLLRSTNRYLKKHKRVYRLERKVIQFISSALSFIDKKSKLSALKNLQTELIQIAEIPAENALLRMFDFQAWVASKIDQKSYSELIREQIQKKLKV